MNKKTLYILLLISLAFNLSFVGSYLYWTHNYHRQFAMSKDCKVACDTPPPPPDHGFGRGYHNSGRPMMMGNREAMRPYQEAFRAKRREFFMALQQPKVDEALLKQKLEASLQAHNNQEKEIGLKLIALRKTMSAEEANVFFGNRMNNPRPHRFNQIPRREK
jgi:hypothetical protein